MKTAYQIAASLLSLAVLLGGAASSQATNVAEVPLRATVLAKPNLIFATDDSGSMDFEMLLDTKGGTLWWDYVNARGKTTGKPLPGGDPGEWEYFYLFPNGVAAGSRQYYDPYTSLGYAVPPTGEVGWVRSVIYNTLYYDPRVTYDPWSPADLGSGVQTFGNATPGAAKSHPVNGSATFKLDANMVNSNTDWRFTFSAGMTIPAGATVHDCYGGSAPSGLPYTVTASRVACMASLPYYPATYWMPAECGVVDNVSCALGPDDQKLKRFEIKAGVSFAPYSSRTYTAEMQNFANWFTYYRKRRLMLAASMGQVLENLSGLRMGVVYFNNRQPVTMFDADATSSAANRLRVAGMFYTPERNAGTPTREALLYSGAQFQRTDNDTQGNKIIQYACQRNYTFVVTDGFAAPSSVTVPSYSQATYGSGAPYSTIHAKSLADIALAYYTINLRPDLATGQVPKEDVTKQNADRNANPHMNTFGLTLGLRGLQWPGITNPFTTPPAWAAPTVQDRTQIDDLWHATLNGRGKMYVATTPDETTKNLQAGINEILNFVGSQGGVALATGNLARGDGMAYTTAYNPAGWSGDVFAYGVNSTTGAIGAAETWKASTALDARDWTTRVIAAGGGVAFTAAGVGATVNPGSAYGSTANVINYLRGDRSNEGTLFRQRTSRLAAIINAEPAISDGVLYVPTGDGMLHAFDTRSPDAGKELWAFVPRAALADMGPTTARGWSFRTQLDGTPTIGSSGGSGKLLVAGMGAGGRSFYALDVSAPRGLSESALAGKTNWEFPAAGDSAMAAKVGQSVGKPQIVKSQGDGQVVLVTSGYNNTADGKGRLWMLNASSGAVIKEFVVAAGTLAAESGLAQVSPYLEPDGSVQYAYGGDLLGNVWRFDLTGKGAPKLLAVLKGPAGDLQGVTAAPELVSVQGKRVVVVGTGRILDVTDWGNNKVQSIYAISDAASLSNARTSLVQQTYNRVTDTMSSNPVDWATQRGWYLDLAAGEHINVRPLVAYGALGFVSNKNGANDCSASSYFYWVNVLSGGKIEGTTYVSVQISDLANASKPTAMLTSEGVKFVTQSNDRKRLPTPPVPKVGIPSSKDSWREVRR